MGRSADGSNRGVLFGASLEVGGVTEAYLIEACREIRDAP